MKQIKLLAVALAALTMFSCSKETIDGPENPTGTTSVQIKIAKGNVTPKSKSIGDAAGANYKTPITGDITVYCFASEAGTSTLLDVKSVTLTDNTTNYTATVANIPSTTGYIYILANATAPTTTIGSTTLDELRAEETAITAGDLQDITKTPMTNATETAQSFDKTNAALWKLSLDIAPVMARVEIGAVEGITDIASFDLVGVYMDHYYPSFTLGGAGAGTITPSVTAGTALAAGWWSDVHNPALTGKTTYTGVDAAGATADQIWSYMLAPAANTTAPAVNNMPKIIVKLANVKLTSDVPYNFNYLTVKKFRTGGTGTVDDPYTYVTEFKRNSIYKITKIEFTKDNLTVDPNQEDVSVEVTVSVLEWNSVPVTPEL